MGMFFCSPVYGHPAQSKAQQSTGTERLQSSFQIKSAHRINPTTVEVLFTDNRRMTFDFYADHIFRLFQDNKGGTLRDPQAKPQAQILVDNPRRSIGSLDVSESADEIVLQTPAIKVSIKKANSLLSVINTKTSKTVLEWSEPAHFEKDKVALSLKENPDEYFYGGGVQNGRFSRKGK